MQGVAVVDPARIRAEAPPLTPVIEDVRLGGQQVDVGEGVTLSPGAPGLDVQFTAATFIRPEQVRFRYRLIGLDDDWIDAGEHRTASFHRLPAGRYLLTVAAAHPDGPWHTAGSAVPVVVLPAFWQTRWFLALTTLAAAALAYAVHHARVRRLRAQHALQIAFSQQLIDSQERERRRLSHELHDSLGQHVAMIRRRTKMARNAAGHAPGTLGDLELIGSLAGTIATEMKEIAQGLCPHDLDQIGLVKTIARMVRQVSEVSGTPFVVELAPIDDLIPEPARIHVFRIVQESVSNVVKHAQARHGRVAITLEDRSIRIVVEDDGRGPARQPGGAPAPVEGMGIRGLRERARILGARLRIGKGPGGGTAVEVTIPLSGTGHA
jgi:signal transduction histidine kinase